MNDNYLHFKRCISAEMLNKRKFTWRRVIHRYWSLPNKRFYLWWRLAELFFSGDGVASKWAARYLNRKIMKNFNTEIGLGAKIAPGFKVVHFQGVVITDCCNIGENFTIRQNTTIGIKGETSAMISIGNNVTVGANSCILADKINIGDNVVIGAMSFIGKDIPPNTTVYTEKTNKLISNTIN